MTREQYQERYEVIESAVESGVMTWSQGMAKVSLLTLEFAAEKADAERAEKAPTAVSYWR